MRCLHPRTVGFEADGKTISWSQKNYSKQYATFQLPCGKCIECRLEYARTWAVRCVHEAKMYQDNCFVTLTYSDENLKSPKLQYEDFQKFMKRLRKSTTATIGMFVTGEYGEKTKRPHWHAIIFNWSPKDAKPTYKNDNGDQLYDSEQLTRLWGKGRTDLGSVTFKSAGYVARYAAKKLIHGQDSDHIYHPISKKSSKQAIGKKFLETYYKDIFNYGECIIEEQKISIPRYYIKWLEKNHPDDWIRYVTETKLKSQRYARDKQEKITEQYFETDEKRALGRGRLITPQQVQIKITEERFKRLNQYLKGDI